MVLHEALDGGNGAKPTIDTDTRGCDSEVTPMANQVSNRRERARPGVRGSPAMAKSVAPRRVAKHGAGLRRSLMDVFSTTIRSHPVS